MKDKPQFRKMEHGTFSDAKPGFFPVIVICSDGQNFTIELGEACIPFLTVEVIEKMKFIIEDGIYRVRPDLRKQ